MLGAKFKSLYLVSILLVTTSLHAQRETTKAESLKSVSSNHSHEEEHDEHDEKAENDLKHEHNELGYDEKKGVHLPPESIAFLGLQLGKPLQKTLSVASIPATAQIFRSSSEASTSNRNYLQGFAYASTILDQKYLGKLKVFDKAIAKRLKPNEKDLKATIIAVHNNQIQPQSNEVIIQIEDIREKPLAVGSFIQVQFAINDQQTIISIPHTALLKTTEGYFVYVKNGEYFKRNPVTIGVSTTEWLEAKGGVIIDQEILIKGVEQLWIVELKALKGDEGGHAH